MQPLDPDDATDPTPVEGSDSLPNEDSADPMEEMRRLLLGSEQDQLAAITRRIEDPKLHAEDVGQILPRAVAIAAARDGQLTAALTPTVEAALAQSIRKDPSTLANAIFPVLGPAVRKVISETFNKMVRSINETLEHSFSVRGFKWRLEALRTGRPFAEVVLSHTLVYRVEQVFLIHRQTGLLLHHVTAENAEANDPDIVSGMLTALQDFIRDSFHPGPDRDLESVRVGQTNVWLETGPQAVLAAIVRGEAPDECRSILRQTIERVHRNHSSDLEQFDGDASAFGLSAPDLESCLVVRFGEGRSPSQSRVRARTVRLIAAAAGVLALLGAGWVVRDYSRWSHFIERVRLADGMVITDASWGIARSRISGLRDPLAQDPRELMADSKIDPARVTASWEPYLAISPTMIERRAQRILAPPADVELMVEADGTLIATGTAPGAWTDQATAKAASIIGVTRFDTTQLHRAQPTAPSRPPNGISP